MQDNRSKVLKGVSSQSLVTILGGVVEVVYFSALSRLLSTEEFGLYAVATSLTVILTSLSEAGLGSTLIQRKNPSPQFVNTVFTLSLSLGLFFTASLFIFSSILSNILIDSDVLSLPLKLLSFTLLLNCLIGVARAFFMRRLNFLKYGFIVIGIEIVTDVIAIYLAWSGYGIYSVIWAHLINNIIMFLVLYGLLHIKLKICIVKSEVKEIISYGGWLTGCVIVRNISDQITSLVMPRITSVSLLGTYNRPARLIHIISGKVNGVFDTVLFPILSNIQDERVKISSAFNKIFDLLMISATVLTLSLALGSDLLISIFLGSQWENLKPLLQLLSISVIFSSFSRISDCFLRSLGIMKVYFTIRCATLISTFILVIIGCQFGLYGVAVAYVASKFVDATIKIVYLNNYFEASLLRFLFTFFKKISIPVLFFIPFLLIQYLWNVQGLLTLIPYLLILSGIAMFAPKLFGDVFYNQIYLEYIVKLRQKINM